MERVVHQAEGGTAEDLQGFVERHGAEASVSPREREAQQMKARGVGRRRTCQSIPAAAKQVLNGPADGIDPGGKLHRDHGREQVRLRLGRCSDQARVAAHLDIPGQQIARSKQAGGRKIERRNRLSGLPPS